ncbi:LuxR family transcriptional regulator [Streptomyces sp. A012304]|uniref:helix-turn-helix transcriptional regulator n=1 Tax=Streptomyces sp. A012304 TaxID=375446 RepID=UPI00222EA144|nr:LuxR family transcriptional regulator [Streptomyces sp. A012304]
MRIPSRGNPVLAGRREELEELVEALRAAGSQGRLLAVLGLPGVGKTTLVEAALRTAARDRHLVLALGAGTRRVLGPDALVDQVCDTLVGESGTRALVMTLRRKQTRTPRDGRYGLSLMLETLTAVERAAASRPLAVLLDDAHLVPEGDRGAVGALVHGLRSAGACVVVCAVTTHQDTGAVAVRGLVGHADRTLTLPPLTTAQSAELIGRHLGMPPAPELVATVRRGLGPLLAGNPGALTEAVGALRRRDRLVEVDGRVHLDNPHGVVSLPGFPTRLRALRPYPCGAPDADDVTGEVLALLTRLTAAGETTLDDFLNLAPAFGASADRLGQALDALVALDLVAVDDRQRLTCAVPAVAIELPPGRTERDVARLHARLVLNAHRGRRAAVRATPARLVDHAVAAGAELPTPLRTELLLAGAWGSGRQDPHRALRACRVLVRELPPDDPRLPGLLRTAVPLMLRHGEPADLLDLGTRLLPRLAPGAAAPLAPAWALAAAHDQWLGARTATEPTPAARAARRAPSAARLLDLAVQLAGEPDGGRPAQEASLPPEFPPTGVERAVPSDSSPTGVESAVPSAEAIEWLARAWDRGDRQEAWVEPVPDGGRADDVMPRSREASVSSGPGVRADDVLDGQEASVSSGPGVRATDVMPRLREALALGDLVSAWEALPGERWTTFRDSPLHVHRTLVREYLTGSWDVALRLAGSLEADRAATGHGPLYLHSRSIAAEICRRRGDIARAGAWLDRVTDGAGRWPLPVWARMGLRHSSGDTTGAWRQGLRDCHVLWRGGRVAGLERPLVRVVEYAVDEARGADAARTALEMLEELDAAAPSRLTRAAALLARGFVRDDVDSAARAYDLLAAGGGRQPAFSAARWLLRRTGEEKWLREAWRQHEGMSSRPDRDVLVNLARRFGLPVPRQSEDRPVLGRLELRVIEMVAAGSTNRQMAAALARSEKTIEAYLARIFKRTGCRSRVELATAWLDGGLTRMVP